MEEEDFFGPDEVMKKVDTEVKRLADLFRFALKYKEQFKPSGIEFSDLRQYQTGDDASRIDWKNSASSSDLYVKEYEEEKNMDVFIVMDASDTMMFGTAEKIKAEYATIVSAAIAYASIDSGINAGVGIYGDDQLMLTPEGGMAQYQKILHEVTNFDNYGGTFNLEEALNSVIGRIKADTAVFIISDFINAEGDWKPKMTVCSEKYRHVMSIMTRDMRDYKLPESGNMRFESITGSGQLTVNTSKVRDEFEEEAKKEEERIKSEITGGGSSFLKVDTRENFSARFAEYFDKEGASW